MLDDVIRYLACPYCADALRRDGGSLRCAAGHTFDIARQGYVSLLPAGSKGGGGDTAAMVSARAGFLAAGHFATLAEDLAKTVLANTVLAATGDAPGCVADAGAGTGYFLAAVLDRLPGRVGLALDVSKPALRQAARAHPRLGAIGCDVWQRLPVADGAALAALSVFAPRNGAELRRILHPDGRLIVVTPQPGHLRELVGPLGLLSVDRHKDERLAGQLAGYFAATARSEHVTRLSLTRAEAGALAAMGPSAWHLDEATLAGRLAGLAARVHVTLAVTITVYSVRAPVDDPRGPGREAIPKRST
ncbi:MAG TPA: 23S rRNA methyltransferase [Streptosporangiaceae bacterium]|jgi:23S rRNA (guanine745-N1)-methyltransferase|nr:23S rRNA methyltransferase [Streptosporangiaceae bacterium]